MKGNSQAFGGIALVVALVAAALLVYSVSHLLPPIVLGLLLGYVVYPLIRLLSRIGLPRGSVFYWYSRCLSPASSTVARFSRRW